MSRFTKKRMYTVYCETDYDEQVCREFAENEDLNEDLKEAEEE